MLRPMPIEPVPPETARVARAAFPKGHRDLRVADELATLFTDDTLVALFPTQGQPAQPLWRLALITLLLDVQGLAWPAAPAGHGSTLSLGADATSARYLKAGLGPSLPRARVCRCFLAGARGNPSSRAGFKRWHGAWGVSAKRRAGIKAQRRSTRAFAGRLPTVPAGRWCARRACWCGCQRRQ